MANEKRLIDANAYAYPGDLVNEPTVDAVEVVHANWIEDGYYGNTFVCSHCGSEGCYSGDFKNKQYYYTNYCPNCGAKMDGGNEDDL